MPSYEVIALRYATHHRLASANLLFPPDEGEDPHDKEVRVAAELPGLDEKDIELLIDQDVLTIRGEKRSETEDKGRHFSERYYGRFERSIALPFEVEEDKAEASFKNGVLTVTLPKSAKAQDTAKRIAINGRSDTKH